MFRLSLLFFHFTSFSSLNSSDMFYSKCYLCYTEGKILKTLGVQSGAGHSNYDPRRDSQKVTFPDKMETSTIVDITKKVSRAIAKKRHKKAR